MTSTSSARIARDLASVDRRVSALSRTMQIRRSSYPVTGPDGVVRDVPIADAVAATVELDARLSENVDALDVAREEVAALSTTLVELETGTLPALREAIEIAQATADSTVKVHFEADLGAGVKPTLNDTSDRGDLYYRLDGQVERWTGTSGGWILVEDTALTKAIADLRRAEGAIATLRDTTLPALEARVLAAEDVLVANDAAMDALDGRLIATESGLATAKIDLDAAEADLATAKGTLATTSGLVDGWKVTGKTTIDGGKIEADSVSTAQLKAGAITAAKAIIGSGAILEANIADAAISTAKIKDAAIVDAKIGSLSATKIDAGTLAAARIGARSITADKITARTLTAAEIAARTITADEIAVGTLTAASGVIGDAAITTAKIADAAITNAKVQGLSAEKLDAGTIHVDRLAARSIGTDKLIVLDQTSYWPDPLFTNPAGYPGWEVVNGGIERVSTAANDGGTFPHLGAAVTGGDRFVLYLRRDTLSGTAGGRLGLLARYYDAAGSMFSFTVPIYLSGEGALSGEFTVPANAVRAEWGIRVANDVPAGARIRVTRPMIRRVSGGELIVDGAIVASKIGVGAVVAEKIATSAITAEKIAVGAITAEKLDVAALNGKTITGATIQTAASGDRIILDAGNRLQIVRASGVPSVTTLAPDDYGLAIRQGTSAEVFVGSGPSIASPYGSGVVTLDVHRSSGGNAIIQTDVVRATKAAFIDGEPVVYRQAAGRAVRSVAVSAGASTTVAVTFPAGRFTVPPILTAVAENGRFTVGIDSITTTGAVLSLNNWSPGGGNPGAVHWRATQALASSAAD